MASRAAQYVSEEKGVRVVPHPLLALNAKEVRMYVWTLIRVAAGFMSRRRRPFAVAAVLLLVLGPLPLTGSVEVLALNAAGLAWVALLLLRLAGLGNRNKNTTRTTRRRTR